MVNGLNRTSHFGEKEALYMAVINKYRVTLGTELCKKECDSVEGNNVDNPLSLYLLWGQGDLSFVGWRDEDLSKGVRRGDGEVLLSLSLEGVRAMVSCRLLDC